MGGAADRDSPGAGVPLDFCSWRRLEKGTGGWSLGQVWECPFCLSVVYVLLQPSTLQAQQCFGTYGTSPASLAHINTSAPATAVFLG